MNNCTITQLSIFVLMAFLQGCAQKQHIDLTEFNAHRPRSILVVPAVNDTTEVSASSVFMTTITLPLAERGYYVFPVYLTDVILKDFGLAEAGHIQQIPTTRFYDLFGADAVLFVTIKDWSTKYLVVSSSVDVEIEYVLKDTRTSQILWQNSVKQSHGSGVSVNPITMAVNAAMNALMTDYLPLAHKANAIAFQPPKGLPVGPYHPEYQKDSARF
jgi:hypothetical protein